eukprot:3581881-Pyramimonas_sp.AAC.1
MVAPQVREPVSSSPRPSVYSHVQLGPSSFSPFSTPTHLQRLGVQLDIDGGARSRVAECTRQRASKALVPGLESVRPPLRGLELPAP